MSQKSEVEFPVGFHKFNNDLHLNFEMNRWHSFGCASFEDLKREGPQITTLKQWKETMVGLARKAISNNNLLYAAFYYRAAEFFTSSTDPEKEDLYRSFIHYFNQYFQSESIERFQIPYNQGILPGIRIPPSGEKKLTLVVHGGFDSFAEEFYPILKNISSRTGYEIIVFDGPGQGTALHRYGLKLIHEWEKPVRAVLDYFQLKDVTLLGISFGGYLALRAAAFEPRIARLIEYDVFYDYGEGTFAKMKFLETLALKFMLKRKLSTTFNRMVEKVRQQNMFADWVYDHGMFITGTTSPFDLFQFMLKFSAREISQKITQDVLLLAGAEDHLVPIKLFYKQKRGLTNAKSVTGRVFTTTDQAAAHCQVGNLRLAIDYILDWLHKNAEK